MASSTSISDTLTAFFKKLPNSINGNGQNFIYLLKDMMSNLTSELDDKFEEISKIANAVTDTPDTTTQQLKNCKLQEVRVGTAISFVLTWDYSAVENYESSEIYIQETEGTAGSVIDWTKVNVARQIRTTKTDTYTVDGINAGYVYKIRFQGKNNLGTVSEEDGNPTLTYAVSAINNSPDPATNFSCYFNRDGVLWSWRQPVGVDYAYSELRTDSNVGNATGLLEITQDTQSSVLPPTREGVAYLYNKGYGDKYSTAVTCNYSKPVPAAPESITATSTYQGLQFEYSEIPSDCIGICISVNGKKHYTKDDKFNYYCSTGSYTYKACFYDCFGEGTYSAEQTLGTLEEIPPDAVHITTKTVFDDGVIIGKYIGDKEIVGTKIADGTITTINIAADAITANQIGANAVTTDKLDASSVTADKIATGSITTDKLDAGAVTADKISSGSITTEKLAADSIDMAGELKIVGGAVTLDENGLEVANGDGTKIIFSGNGMISSSGNGDIFNVTTRSIMGSGRNGQHVKFTGAWPSVPKVVVSPISLITADNTKANAIIRTHCYADNISTTGFDIVCYSSIDSSIYYVSINNTVFSHDESIWGGKNEDDNEINHADYYSASFSIPLNTNYKTVNIQMNLFSSCTWGHTSEGGPLAPYGILYDSGTTSYVTLQANGTTIWGGWFSFGTSGNSANSQTISTGVIQVNGVSTITGTIFIKPKVMHYGDSSDTMTTRFQILNMSVTQDTGSATEYIDSHGEAAFLVIDSKNNNYTVS